MSELLYWPVDGVMWCSSHHGVVDECADHVDDEGEPCCDMAVDGGTADETPCNIHPLYFSTVTS